MEIMHVQYFLALCEEGNFTRAAQRCHVSQPSITNAIRALEREYGAPLFVRKPAPVRPSELGLLLKPLFEQIGACTRQIKTELAQFNDRSGNGPAIINLHPARRSGRRRNSGVNGAAMRKAPSRKTVEGQASHATRDYGTVP